MKDFKKMSQIHRNISAEEAVSEMARSKVEAAIFVQCLNSCPDEVAWVESLAAKNPLIKGIVGGLDLTQVKEQSLTDIRMISSIPGPRVSSLSNPVLQGKATILV